MRIGFMSTFDTERIEFMTRHGFGCVELMVPEGTDYLPGHDGWKNKADKAKAAFEDAGIRISCLAGFYVNHMDADPTIARQHHDQVRNVITLAKHMGVHVVAGFAGRILGEDLDASIPAYKQIWGEHASFAADHNVKIAFEHCPMGQFNSPFDGFNCMCTPDMWDKCFDAVPSDTIGLEWDSSHLICQLIDPVCNVKRYGHKIFHVHAKDARVNRDIVERFGLYHPMATEHCFVGLGDSDWAAIIKELLRAGYTGDMNIEGWHDNVYRNHDKGPQLEDQGLLISLNHLSPYVDSQ